MQSQKLIVSVCRGNIARSAVSESLIRKEIEEHGLGDTYISISRGVQGTSVDPQPVTFPNITHYGKLYDDLRPTLEKFGIDLSTHVSTPIDRQTAEQAIVMFAMDRKTKRGLEMLFPDQTHKIHLLSELVGEDKEVIDPEGVSGADRQEQIFTQIQNTIVRGFPTLIALTEGVTKIRQDMNYKTRGRVYS